MNACDFIYYISQEEIKLSDEQKNNGPGHLLLEVLEVLLYLKKEHVTVTP